VRYRVWLDMLYQSLQEGKLTLRDIGKTEAKIEQLRVNGCRAAALHWFKLLKHNPPDYGKFIPQMCNELQAGSLTLKHINTTEAKINLLVSDHTRTQGDKTKIPILLALVS
jgi:hypothetical protein